jgi:hypothetical protein
MNSGLSTASSLRSVRDRNMSASPSPSPSPSPERGPSFAAGNSPVRVVGGGVGLVGRRRSS